ncbi:MAG: manganese efflux pump [Lachnospiraceae bacterium]|nr:manganese efflux pump [Lachnospiraceae bacterium]
MSYAVSTLLIFLTAVSLDSLTAGFSYGTKKVHVEVLSLLLLACVPSVFITAAGSIGSLIGSLFPAGVLPFLSFSILFVIGSIKLLESLIRYLAKKHPGLIGSRGCKIKQVNIIFTVYLSPEEANRTDLQVLSAKEALLLSLALSLDSVLVGMAFSASAIPRMTLLFSAVIFNLFLFLAGYALGRLLSHILRIDLSWLSGLCLLLLAFRALT